MRASPRDVAKSTLHTRSASLEAALEALDASADDLVTVPPVRNMDVYTFRLHLRKRHKRVRHEFISHHALDHARNPDLDHIHKEES